MASYVRVIGVALVGLLILFRTLVFHQHHPGHSGIAPQENRHYGWWALPTVLSRAEFPYGARCFHRRRRARYRHPRGFAQFGAAEAAGCPHGCLIDLSASTFVMFYVMLAVFGLVIGLIGSAFAMRRYLKV